jgi:hypothetical protein
MLVERRSVIEDERDNDCEPGEEIHKFNYCVLTLKTTGAGILVQLHLGCRIQLE